MNTSHLCDCVSVEECVCLSLCVSVGRPLPPTSLHDHMMKYTVTDSRPLHLHLDWIHWKQMLKETNNDVRRTPAQSIWEWCIPRVTVCVCACYCKMHRKECVCIWAGGGWNQKPFLLREKRRVRGEGRRSKINVLGLFLVDPHDLSLWLNTSRYAFLFSHPPCMFSPLFLLPLFCHFFSLWFTLKHLYWMDYHKITSIVVRGWIVPEIPGC